MYANSAYTLLHQLQHVMGRVYSEWLEALKIQVVPEQSVSYAYTITEGSMQVCTQITIENNGDG